MAALQCTQYLAMHVGQTGCYYSQLSTLGWCATLSNATMFSLFLHLKYLACVEWHIMCYSTYYYTQVWTNCTLHKYHLLSTIRVSLRHVCTVYMSRSMSFMGQALSSGCYQHSQMSQLPWMHGYLLKTCSNYECAVDRKILLALCKSCLWHALHTVFNCVMDTQLEIHYYILQTMICSLQQTFNTPETRKRQYFLADGQLTYALTVYIDILAYAK